MSSFFEPISHPDRTLAEHLAACDWISERLLARKYVEYTAFFAQSDLENWRRALVYFHDLGKASRYFQAYLLEAMLDDKKVNHLNGRFAEYLGWARHHLFPLTGKDLAQAPSLSNHAKLGAYFLADCLEGTDPLIQAILLKIVRRHHGSLTNFGQNGDDGANQIALTDHEKEELGKQAAALQQDWLVPYLQKFDFQVDVARWPMIAQRFGSLRAVNKLATELEKSKDYRYFFLQHFLFSLLLSADKGDVMLTKGEWRDKHLVPPILFPDDIVPNFKVATFEEQPAKPIDLEREAAFQLVAQRAKTYAEHSFFSITLPTGMGKTFAAYQAAILLQRAIAHQSDKVFRMVYCLPFTSIIDQNADILEKIFKHNNLNTSQLAVHHHLAFLKEDDGESLISVKESEYLTEGWEHSWVVTTFIQFFESLFTNRNSALRKFHNLVNAVVVLDEVQNIPPKYFEAIEVACKKMAEYFGTRFIFVTATQPMLFANPEEVVELTAPQTEQFFRNRERIEIRQELLKRGEKIQLNELAEHAQRQMQSQPDQSFLLITNTIAQSRELYGLLENSGKPIFYLSASILPVFRKQLIPHIKSMKGGKILVSTQVVEAGVDIDFDVVYRDFAPLDSINQSAGRCNRNGLKGKGRVYLYDSGKSRIYDPVLLAITREVLDGYPEVIPEPEFWGINQQYAQKVRQAVAEASDESAALLKAMQRLQLDDVAKGFTLIKELPIYVNVFIPFTEKDLSGLSYEVQIPPSEMPEPIWARYQDCLAIEDPFERKEQLRQIMPYVLRYVAKFPKKHYSPSQPDQLDKAFIFEPDWREFYDLERGFQTPDPLPNEMFF